MDAIETIERIEDDFINKQPPFDKVQFPEERLLEELPHNSMEDRLRLVSMFATFDYNRNANQLVDNIIELHSSNAKIFDAWHVGHNGTKAMEDLFKKIGFRYPTRDANGWEKNCTILTDNYSGKWHELLLDTGCHAPSLVEQLNEDGFLYLKGDKIAPMYARIINDDVCELDDVWQLNIPVDTHIRRLSKELFAGAAIASETKFNDDDYLRLLWHDVADEHDISRHVVDGAMWHIGNKWEEWGEDYWNEVTE